MESHPKLTLEKGKMYYFICFALTAGGKSTFYNTIIEQCNKDYHDQFNLTFVSSDQIRQDLAKKYHESHKDATYEKAFDAVGKATAKEFDSQVNKALNSMDNNKVNIVLVDKNYPNGISKFKEIFCKDPTNCIVVLFVPKITRPIIAGKFKCPFSYDYVFQCLMRLKGRTGHETLNGDSKNSLYIYLSFLKLFQNFVFADHISEGVYLKEISFSDESQEIEPIDKIKELFSGFLFKMKAFKFDIIDDYQENIDTLSKMIDLNYSTTFKDTRHDIIDEVHSLLSNGL